ncbi:hypothetical protein PIB30_045070 [Stylosanthes scabra]|uniref:Uncharacterized protein n=1 Tax=Stylosanthes scabra TaxID=79078 RepID=A0ABU6VFD6_9FABA|nr:hypothetical protein [Stylosanthes scabra]
MVSFPLPSSPNHRVVCSGQLTLKKREIDESDLPSPVTTVVIAYPTRRGALTSPSDQNLHRYKTRARIISSSRPTDPPPITYPRPFPPSSSHTNCPSSPLHAATAEPSASTLHSGEAFNITLKPGASSSFVFQPPSSSTSNLVAPN